MGLDRNITAVRAQRLIAPLLPALLVAGAAWPGAPPAALGAAVRSALVAALALAGGRLAARALPGAALSSRATAAVVFATALAILPAVALGHLGHLRPGPYLFAIAAVAVGALLLAPAGRSAAERAEPPAAVADPGSRRLRAVERGLAAAAVLALAVATADEIRDARYLPAGSFGVDDPSYHLTAVATWAERGDLAMVKFAVGDASTPYYPIAGELIAWVLLAPFESSDVAARWAQLPYALATLLAMAALARRLGLRRRSILPALALYWSMPKVFPFFALAAGNDHATAFFLLAAADGALELARRRRAGAGLYAGAALGLLLGTKYLGLLLAPLIAGIYCVARIAGRRRAAPGAGWTADLAAVSAAAVCGGYTYLRNAIVTGNPIFPAPLTLGGLELFEGWEGVTLEVRRHLPEFAIDLPGFLFRADLWGPVASWFLVPAAVLAPLAAALMPRGRRPVGAAVLERPVEAALLLLPAATFLIFLFQVHDHRDVRYFLGGIAIAAVGWGWLTDRLERSGPAGTAALASALRSAALAAALLVVARPALWPPERWLLLVPIAAAGALAAVSRQRLRRALSALSARRAAAAALAALLLWPALAHVAERYPRRKLEHLPMAALLESLAGPAGTTVAYVGLNAPYPLWGSRLQNRVVIVPTGDDPGERLYDWGGGTRQPFRDPMESGAWISNLERLGVRWIVVVRSGEHGPEHFWMRRRPGRFTRVALVGDQELWRFRSDREAARGGPPEARRPLG